MSRFTTLSGPRETDENERSTYVQLERLLNCRSNAPARFVTPSGEEIEIPETLYLLLRHIVQLLANDEPVCISPTNKELTSQQAADLLNVSRPYLVQLLDRERIPYRRVGTHRRIRLEDILAYKRRRDEERRIGLRELTALSQQLGMYDERQEQQ